MMYLLAIAYPLLAAFVVTRLAPGEDERHSRGREVASRVLVATGAVPALLIALLVAAGDTADLPWLLLDVRLGLTTTTQVFLLFTALLWTVAGIYAGAYHRHDRRRGEFFLYYLLTLSGNLGLILALDVVTFYTSFAVMTFAGYGLVVHERSELARHAAQTYIIMAILGEVLLLAALFLASADAADITLVAVRDAVAVSPQRDLIMGLLFFGFGVKAGTLAVHMWLPLAHPAAPTPASAVLSGAMIKAGLLGWIHLLPMGEVALPGWSGFLIVWGLLAAFFAVAVGVTQIEPKTNLAYSSISQMGVMTVALGVGLAHPEAWQPALSVLLIYAFSHSLAKGTLFLGVGVASGVGVQRWKRMLVMGGLFVAAVAIAGAPMTGGGIAKKALEGVAPYAPGVLPELLDFLLPLSAVATTLLMGRFLFLMWPMTGVEKPKVYGMSLWWSWLFVLSTTAVGIWLVVPWLAIEVPLPDLAVADVWDGLWPIIAGAAVLGSLWQLQRWKPIPFHIPAGDVLSLVARPLLLLQGRWARRKQGREWIINLFPVIRNLMEGSRRKRQSAAAEAFIGRWDVVAAFFLLLVFAFIAALVLS